MKSLAKRTCCVIMAIISTMTLLLFGACSNGAQSAQGEPAGPGQNIQSFYDKVVESQQYLDTVADDIYSYWYDAIYKDKYSGNINLAIYYAQQNNSENLALIEANDAEIKSLYRDVKNSDLSAEVKAVMSAYSDYYEFVVNVSGSFKIYSENQEKLKKELASAIKKLALEM